jgi:hypothetical protein
LNGWLVNAHGVQTYILSVDDSDELFPVDGTSRKYCRASNMLIADGLENVSDAS